MPEKLRIAFVTNFCSHYRVKTFETLARCHNIDYYFYSPGDEWYWRKEHGTHAGDFRYEYLNGSRIGRTRVVQGLLLALPSLLIGRHALVKALQYVFRGAGMLAELARSRYEEYRTTDAL